MNFECNHKWHLLYRITVHLIVTMLILILIQIIVFVMFPPPKSVIGFFELFQNNWFLGLLSLDLIYIFNNLIIIVIYLSLFVLLYKETPVISIFALILGLVGITCYFPSNPAFEMMKLSTKYFSADPSSQIIYQAAGEALMAGYTGTAFNIYYELNAIALLLFSYIILKSKVLSKAIGIWGFASGILMIIPSTAGLIGLVFSLLSLIPWIIFSILLMGKLRVYYR